MPDVFDIDTGSRSEVDINSPSVEKFGFKGRYPKHVDAITGWGVGGAVKSYVVRLPYLTIGRTRNRASSPIWTARIPARCAANHTMIVLRNQI